MTAKKDLKRRVRERMAQTGESYTQALAHVRAGEHVREPAPPARKSLIERAAPARDISAIATREGFPCPAFMNERSWEALEAAEGAAATFVAGAFERLRAMLVASIGDPSADAFRARVVLGQATPPPRSSPLPLLAFYRRVGEGHRGCDPYGSSAFIDMPRADGTNATVLFLYLPAVKKDATPRLVVTVGDRMRYSWTSLGDAYKIIAAFR